MQQDTNPAGAIPAESRATLQECPAWCATHPAGPGWDADPLSLGERTTTCRFDVGTVPQPALVVAVERFQSWNDQDGTLVSPPTVVIDGDTDQLTPAAAAHLAALIATASRVAEAR